MNPIVLGIVMFSWYVFLVVAGIRRDKSMKGDPKEVMASKMRGFLLVCFLAAIVLVVGMVFKVAFAFPLMAIVVGSYSTWAGVAHLRNPDNLIGAIPGLGEKTFSGVFARVFGAFALGVAYLILLHPFVPE